jgi:hypothetical protein
MSSRPTLPRNAAVKSAQQPGESLLPGLITLSVDISDSVNSLFDPGGALDSQTTDSQYVHTTLGCKF